MACKPRIVIIDPHGEYGHAFKERAVIYRAYDPIGTEETSGTPIRLPYWLMSADEFRRLVIGKTEEEATSQNNIVYKALAYARMVAGNLVAPSPTSHGSPTPTDGLPPDEPRPKAGVTQDQITGFDRDKPRPFSLLGISKPYPLLAGSTGPRRETCGNHRYRFLQVLQIDSGQILCASP